MNEYMPYIWLAVIVFTAVCEVATAQLVSIWFVIGGVGALITSLFTDNIIIQCAVFFVVTLVTLVATRPIVKKMKHFKKTETNSDRAIGKTADVIVEVNNLLGQGQVNVEGVIWSARSDDEKIIEKGEKVEVLRIEGVKLIVKQIKEKE